MTLRSKITLLFVLLVVAASPAWAFTFIHMTDVHMTVSGAHKDNLDAIIAEVNAMTPRPEFVVVTGDITETGRPGDVEMYKTLISAFEMPVYNVMGNHETKWSNWGTTSLKRMLGQESRYSFDHQGVHFVGLDSSMWMQHHGLVDRSQITWLLNDLSKAGRKTPSILYYHHCPGFNPAEAELLRAIKPYNVRLILVGHGHTFKTWKRNGLWFQEGKGAMNDKGGYRIIEITGDEIRSYQKLVGKEKVADGVIPLNPERNPVMLLDPKPGAQIEGQVDVRALVMSAENRKVEYSLGGEFKPLPLEPSGLYEVKADFDGTAGWNVLTVRATDPDGMEWHATAPVRINADGREAWRVETSGAVQRAVTVYGDRVYFGTIGGDVYCLEARTGNQVWRHSTGSDVISEVATNGRTAYLGVADGRIIALDAETGAQRWAYRTGGPVQGVPVLHDGMLLVGSGESAYYALDAETGKLRWRRPMERMTQVHPVVIGDTIYFGAWDKYFYALNTKDGSLKWRTLIGINFFYSTASSDPVTDGKRIVANVTPYKPEDPDIYCLDASSGEILWKMHNPGRSDCGFNSPCIIGDKLYCIAGNGELFCLNMADGKETWRSHVGVSVLNGKPVHANGKLYVPGLRGNVVCVDASDGKKLWTYSTGVGYLFGFAAAWEDLVLVPSIDGSVTALKQ